MTAMRRWLVAAAMTAAVTMTFASNAFAWKPYTHVQSGYTARADAVDDGKVTVAGKSYPVDARVVDALRSWPSYYNAGVVGPDGFPDLTMGQSVIHPERTGAWLRYVLDRAWAAQTDNGYSAAEKGQILAFGYGFLTHAAGDMWAHTLVNEFAEGVFPGLKEIFTNLDDAEIAIRHIIVEGYIGDATRGYDGNDDRTLLPDGDISDDSTAGISFDAPIRWIYQTLVRPDAFGAPTTKRGPLIDFFLKTQAGLQETKAKVDFDRDWTDCAIIDPDCYEVTKTLTVDTVRGVRHPTVTVQECIGATIGCLISPVDVADDLILNNIGSAYMGAWIDDIQSGLEHWGELGLASTRALFDPQARRNLQNEECKFISEGTQARENCEAGVGAIDVLFEESDDFIDDHLLSMLGAPDAVGAVHDLLQALGDLVDEVVGPALNPLRIVGAALEEAAKDLIKDVIEEAYGIDVEQLEDFLTHPTAWLDVQSTTLTLPGVGNVSLELFEPWVHDKLDAYMHLAADHHTGGVGTRLDDDAEFSNLAPFDNTVTMAKLALLDGAELDHALGDILVDRGVIKNRDAVTTYPAGTNVMFQPLHGDEPWLQLIDGDHSWRANGLPFFCERDDQGSCALGHQPDGSPGATLRRDRASQIRAGNGEFPIWESCVLRPAFRTLFTDWENGAQQFPDLGDATSSDPSDPNAPATAVSASGKVYASGSTTFVGGSNTLTVSATDAVFTNAHVSVQAVLSKDGTVAGPFAAIANGGTLSIAAAGGDGLWHVDTRASDPCNAFGASTRTSFVLDTTPPVTTFASPRATPSYDTDDVDTIAYSVADGTGSGVKSDSVTLDSAAASNGQTLDMFLLGVGTHTVNVTATDNVDNAGTTPRAFTIHATTESLAANLERVKSEGKITDPAVYAGLRDKVTQALKKHQAGQHAVEANALGAFVDQLLAQRGKGIDAAMADRLIASARDIVATGY